MRNILHISGATGNEFVNIVDMSIRSNKIKVTKANPAGYYRYPDVVYFAVSASKDRGFPRTGDVLHVSAGNAVDSGGTKKTETILCREFFLKSAAPVVHELFKQESGGEFDCVVDISSISGQSSDFTQLYLYKRDGVTSFNRVVGAPVYGWTFSVVGSSARITISDGVKRTFFIKLRFVSLESTVVFPS